MVLTSVFFSKADAIIRRPKVEAIDDLGEGQMMQGAAVLREVVVRHEPPFLGRQLSYDVKIFPWINMFANKSIRIHSELLLPHCVFIDLISKRASVTSVYALCDPRCRGVLHSAHTMAEMSVPPGASNVGSAANLPRRALIFWTATTCPSWGRSHRS